MDCDSRGWNYAPARAPRNSSQPTSLASDQPQLERYTPADRPEVFAFIRAAYPQAHGERLIAQWDWKYDANPFNADGDPYVLLVKDGTRVVGMAGSYPVRVLIGGSEHRVGQGGDWIVHPGYRGRGLALHFGARKRADIPMSFGWSRTEPNHTERGAGVRWVNILPLIKPLDYAALLQRASGWRWPGAALARLSGRLPSIAAALGRMPRVPGVQVVPIATFDARFDRLWRQASAQHAVVVVRDERYLRWRFGERPDQRYTIYAATHDGDIVGYVVIRSTEQYGLRVGCVVDVLTANQSVPLIRLLLDTALEHLRHDGVAVVTCRVTAPAYRAATRRAGFFPMPWASPSYFVMRVDRPDTSLQCFRDERQWFVTMGDGDLEMSF